MSSKAKKKKVRSYKLDDIVRKDVSTVPDKYFEELPQRIQDRIGETNLMATKKVAKNA